MHSCVTLNTMCSHLATMPCPTRRQPRVSVVRVTDDYARLLEAASLLRPGKDVAGRPAALARFLNISHQNLRHWEKRGIAQREHVRVSGLIGCRAEWLATGEGTMTLDGYEPVQQPSASLSDLATGLVAQIYSMDAAGSLNREVARLLEGVMALASRGYQAQESDKATVAIPAKSSPSSARKRSA